MNIAYYNEFNLDAAAWLEELIRRGHIAPGQVDTRSIEDVRPDDLRGFTQCHFFAGIGVWSYALRRAGWDDDRPIWTGSCPCQPFSEAGKGAAFADERHLWPAFHHLIKVCKPSSILGEQVASSAVDDWIDLVHADMEALGYAFGSIPFPSAGVGAPQKRDRAYWMAYANNAERWPKESCGDNNNRTAPEWDKSHRDAWERLHGPSWLTTASEFQQDADGSPARMVRLRGYGNAINAEAAQAWIETVMECIA